MFNKLISYFKNRKVFKEGDILVCVEEQDHVFIKKGERVVLLEVKNYASKYDIRVGYLDKDEDYFQHANSKNFKLKTRPRK